MKQASDRRAARAAYYQAHKAEIAAKWRAYQKAYNESHKAKRAAYCQEHKAEQTAYRKAYWKAHKAEHAARCKVYRKAHKAEKAAYQKAYHEAHKAELAARKRVYREAHKAARAAYQKAYYEAHPDAVLDRCSRRRALERGATVENVSRAVVYERDAGRCHLCGRKVGKRWHLDHLIPLARGGEHSYRNVAVSCPKCNMNKYTKAGAQLRLL